MADKPFRVLLDLTDLHIECLKYVWINVSPHELKTVADFKASVVRKINIEKVDIKLFVRNGLLLDDETVMILREDDTVKVHYVSQHQSDYSHIQNCVEERRSSRKRNHSGSPSGLSLNAKKFNRDSEILTQEKVHSVKINKKKKKHKQSPSLCYEDIHNESKVIEEKNSNTENFHNQDKKQTTSEKNVTDFPLTQESDSFFSFVNQYSSAETNKNKSFKTAINVGSNSCLELDSVKESLLVNEYNPVPKKESKETFDLNTDVIKISDGLSNNCAKKKRKRRKKRKGLETIANAPDNAEKNRQIQPFTNEADKSVQRKHIIYTSSSPQKDIFQLCCDNKNEDVKDLIIDTFVLDKGTSDVKGKPSNNYPKISTPAQSDFCKNPNWCFSVMQQTDLNSHYNENVEFIKGKNRNYADTKSVDEQSISYDNSENNEKLSELSYIDLRPLNSRPDIGAHIAYKILELDEHYSPVISDYREGIVKSINLDNEEMEIELLKHEIKPGRTGKFENLKEDEVPLPEVKTCDIVRWSNLVEPKLLCS